jgi:hypothetical protein
VVVLPVPGGLWWRKVEQNEYLEEKEEENKEGGG